MFSLSFWKKIKFDLGIIFDNYVKNIAENLWPKQLPYTSFENRKQQINSNFYAWFNLCALIFMLKSLKQPYHLKAPRKMISDF